MQNRNFWLTFGAGSFCLKTVGSGRPDGNGKTSGHSIFAVLFVFGRFLQLSSFVISASFFIPIYEYMLPCLFNINPSWIGCFQSFRNIRFCIFEEFLIYTYDPTLKTFSIMPFETLKWFWKFYFENIFKTSHILFNILCASFIFENYIFQKIFQKGY